MRVPVKKSNEEKFPVACANCGKTAWVTKNDLRYCERCYGKITKLWSKKNAKRKRNIRV